MQYFNQDFFKMCLGFLLIICLGLAGVYLATRDDASLPAPAQLTGETN
jgi:hypothetical protein